MWQLLLVQGKRVGKPGLEIVTFGCSYTYGEGLPDVKKHFISGNPQNTSKLGWATLVSQKLKLDLVNISYPGTSNTEILYNILTFNFKADDIVVVMWTHPIRDIMFDKWTRFNSFRTRLGFWKKESNTAWEKQVDIKDYVIKTWMCIHHVDLLLKVKKIKYIHYPQDISEYNDYVIKEIKIDNLHNDGFLKVDKVADGHPGVESNRLTAENIFRILNEK